MFISLGILVIIFVFNNTSGQLIRDRRPTIRLQQGDIAGVKILYKRT